MIEAVPHPDEPTRLLSIDDAISILWRDHLATLALIEGHDTTLADLDARLAAQRSVLSDLTARADGTDKSFVALRAEIAATVTDLAKTLTGRLDTQQADNAALRIEIDALKAQVAALSKPEQTGTALGIDVSKYQTVEQAAAALEGKPDFCIINATTGLFTDSPLLPTHTANSRANADITGFYHWSQTVNTSATTPDKSDPLGEARHFIATSKPQHGDILSLDHEEALGTWAQRVTYAIAWLDEVRAKTGALPLLYINGDWLYNLWTAATAEQRQRLFGTYYLWYARPTGTPGDYGTTTKYRPETYPGVKVLVHQYATTGDMDRNWTPDFAKLRAIAVP